jgi:simple sugar transport system permease protein
MMVAIGSTIYAVPVWIMIALALAMGLAVGALNGFLSVRTGLPSFIVTLGTNFALAGASLGLARLLASTTTVSVARSPSAHAVFASKWGEANVSIL